FYLYGTCQHPPGGNYFIMGIFRTTGAGITGNTCYRTVFYSNSHLTTQRAHDTVHYTSFYSHFYASLFNATVKVSPISAVFSAGISTAIISLGLATGSIFVKMTFSPLFTSNFTLRSGLAT